MSERRKPSEFPLLQEGKLWEVDRESALIIFGGQRALLMQIAHPLIGHAIAEKSDFRKRPIGRLIDTLNPTYNVIFGAKEKSRDGARRINHAHRPVSGVLPEVVGKFPAGTPYDANDPELQQVVWGTLVDSALTVYEGFVKPLSDGYKEGYYQEAKAILGHVGGKPKDAPATYPDFVEYMDGMHQDGTFVVGQDAQELAPHILLQTTPFIRPVASLIRTAARPSARIAVGLLHEPLREQYREVLRNQHGFSFPEGDEPLIDRAARVSRAVNPYLPDVVRFSPHYLRARRQIR